MGAALVTVATQSYVVTMFCGIPEEFPRRYIAGDETWMHNDFLGCTLFIGIEYLRKNIYINRHSYVSLLDRFSEKITEITTIFGK